MYYLISQIPALEIIIPLAAALINLMLLKFKLGELIVKISVNILLVLSCIFLVNLEEPILYYFGNWDPKIGISYKINHVNAQILFFINFILWLFIHFSNKSIDKKILDNINSNVSHIFYSMILLLHTGISGIFSTDDLFHLYVCIEIVSLACYGLISQGKEKHATTAAIDYLIIGTIGATLILFSIGLLLYLTGSLNISFISSQIHYIQKNKLFILALTLFTSGSLLKLALFPFNLGTIRIHYNSNPIILSYISPLMSLVSFYILYLFYYTISDLPSTHYSYSLQLIISICAILSIIIFTLAANIVEQFRSLIISSGASQVGYFVLIFLLEKDNADLILFPYLFIDGIVKFSLFTLLSCTDYKISCFNGIGKSYPYFGIGMIIILLNNAALPFSVSFINKVNLMTELAYKDHICLICIISLISVLSLFYHFKFIKILYSNKEPNITLDLHVRVTILFCSLVLLGYAFFASCNHILDKDFWKIVIWR